MKHVFILSVLVVFLTSGCTQEHKEIHKLDCIISTVIYNQTGEVVKINKKDAIKNGYEYHFRVYDDGVVVVNDAEKYLKDNNEARTYSLLLNDKVNQNMKYTFSETFDDVRFFIMHKDIEYGYMCSK